MADFFLKYRKDSFFWKEVEAQKKTKRRMTRIGVDTLRITRKIDLGIGELLGAKHSADVDEASDMNPPTLSTGNLHLPTAKEACQITCYREELEHAASPIRIQRNGDCECLQKVQSDLGNSVSTATENAARLEDFDDPPLG